ncbi:MAG: class I SAM-dependent methyltransferase [Nitrospinae bacterium]|nr:class I SAM-dependent methyltransferase [Nitrospinota bacterium]
MDDPSKEKSVEDVYREYSAVFDYFSDERFSPSNEYFTNHVAKLIKPKFKICEVGGGTGYFTQKFLDDREDVELLFIEPFEAMLKQAKARLGDSVRYLKNTFEEVVNTLEKQDVFVFQRSFYHLYKDMESYRRLIKTLYDLTNVEGFVCIQNVPPVFDVPEFKKHFYDKHLEHGLAVETFNEKWPVLEKVMLDFNERTARNDYFCIPADALSAFFIFGGFSLYHVDAEHNTLIFCKSAVPLITG